MSENQAIEVGQTWREPGDYGKFFNVQSVSPAWIKLTANYDGEEISVRRGTLREAWRFYPRLDPEPFNIEIPSLDLGEDTPANNTSTHAAMQAAVQAFNAQTGKRIDESDGWLLLHNLSIVLGRHQWNGKSIVSMEEDFNALYEESREVD